MYYSAETTKLWYDSLEWIIISQEGNHIQGDLDTSIFNYFISTKI